MRLNVLILWYYAIPWVAVWDCRRSFHSEFSDLGSVMVLPLWLFALWANYLTFWGPHLWVQKW